MQNTPGQQYPSPAGMPPTLGQQTPGMNSEMPAAGGLSALANPMAKQLQSMGRGDDTMLIHMTPEEVGGLQQLALATGGSLTINPHTGLPEAGWLKKLLPTLIGAILTPLTGGLINPMTAGLLVGGFETVRTGSLTKGLMAGLGAYGGAGLSTALLPGMTGQLAKTGVSTAMQEGVKTAGQEVAKNLGQNALTAGSGDALFRTAGQEVAKNLGQNVLTSGGGDALFQTAGQEVAKNLGQNVLSSGAPQVASGLSKSAMASDIAGLKDLGRVAMQNPMTAAKQVSTGFSDAVRQGLTPGTLPYKYAPQAAGLGVMSNVSDAMQPQMEDFSLPEEKSTYEGPYIPAPRGVSFQTLTGDPSEDSREHLYFNPVNPVPAYVPSKAMSIKDEEKGYAEGGSTSSKTSGLEALIERYASKNPGAITASVNYPAPEKKTTASTTASTTAVTPTPAPTNTSTLTYTGDKTSDNVLAVAPNIDDYIKNVLGGTAPTRTTANGIDLTQLLRDRPDVYKAFFTEYNNPNVNDKNSTAWMNRVGGADPYAYANYWYNTYGKNEGYGQPNAVSPTSSRNIQPGAPQVGRYGVYTPGGGWGDMDFSNLRIMAQGGHVNMGDGSFVVDARTVSELGNGSSNAGIELLRRMGGKPVQGPGDGVSDSVPASIGGKQAARVARDEVIFPPQAVNRMGGGSNKRGADKLYAMMERAHKARKQADRGEDTKLRRGLA